MDRPARQRAPRRRRFVRLRRHQRPCDRRGGARRGGAAPELHALAGRAVRARGRQPRRAGREARSGRGAARRSPGGSGWPTSAPRLAAAERRRAGPTRPRGPRHRCAGEVRRAGAAAACATIRRERWSTRGGAVFVQCARWRASSRSCFPGEGSQYIDMLGDLALCFGEVRHWLDFWHTLYDEPRGANRTDVVFPPASRARRRRRRKRSRSGCTAWTSAARPCSSPARRCTRCCARSASSPT